MQFSLMGSSQSADVRTYVFDGSASGHKTSGITVSVDIALARRYAISLQELPLLCLHFLEERLATSESITLTFSELEMSSIRNRREEAKRVLAMKHKPPRRPRPRTDEAREESRDALD